MTKQEKMIEKIKDQIDPLFEVDNEEGRELLSELAEFIESNLSDF
jgi:hypothetical protein